MADPRWLDPTVDPNERTPGTCYLGDPEVVNNSPVGLARFCTLRSWLSQWSYDDANGDAVGCGPRHRGARAGDRQPCRRRLHAKPHPAACSRRSGIPTRRCTRSPAQHTITPGPISAAHCVTRSGVCHRLAAPSRVFAGEIGVKPARTAGRHPGARGGHPDRRARSPGGCSATWVPTSSRSNHPAHPDPLRTWGQAELDGHHVFWTVHARNKTGRHPRPASAERPRTVPRSGREVRHHGGELPSGHAGEVGSGLRRSQRTQFGASSWSGCRATARPGPTPTRPATPRWPRRPAACDTSTGFPGGPPPRLALSLGDSLAGMFGAQGALAALYRRSVTGRRPGRRRRTHRIMLGRTGIHHSGLRRRRRGARPFRHPPGRHRAVEHLPERRRLVGGDRRQPGHRVRPAVQGDGTRPSWPPTSGSPITVPGAAIKTNSTTSSAPGPPSANPVDIIETLSAAGVIAGPINTVAEVVNDPQLRARGMLVEHHDERLGRPVLGPGVAPVLSESPGSVRNAGSARPGQHNDDVYLGLLGKTRRGTRGSCAPRGSYDRTSTFAKWRCATGCRSRSRSRCRPSWNCSAAVAATGVREVEATAFVSPSKVPSMADAAELAAELHHYPDIEFSALVASPNGAKRAVAAGLRSIEYVVGRRRCIQPGQRRPQPAHEATDQIGEIVAIAHDSDVSRRGHHRHRVGLPVRRAHPAAARARHRRRRTSTTAPTGSAIADTIGTTTPGRVRSLIAQLRPVIGELPLGAHFHNTRGAGLASAYAAVEAGVTRLDASVGGLGGCPFAPGATGNIATEDLVYLLRDSGIDVDVDLQAAIAAADVAKSVVGHDLPSALLRAGDRIGTSMPTDVADRERPPDPGGYRAGRPQTVRGARLSRHDAGRHHVCCRKVRRGVLPLLRRQGRPAGRAWPNRSCTRW